MISVMDVYYNRREPNEEVIDGDRLRVRRVGDRVMRPRHRASDYVSQLLKCLRELGYPHSPCYFGHADGWDVLEYIPGSTGLSSDDQSGIEADGVIACRIGAAMLRRLHDLTAGSELAAGSECVVHGDPSPDNVVFRNGRPMAFIDWDYAAPGRRIDDVAFFAWTWTLYPDLPADERDRRLHATVTGYKGGDATILDPERLVDAIIARQEDLACDADAWWLESTKRGYPQTRALEASRWARTAARRTSGARAELITALVG